MDQKTSYYLAGGIALLVLIVFTFLGYSGGFSKPAPKEDLAVTAFATCLKDKGATFFGTFWCPHCAAQKKLFGGSVKALPYVECSTPDGQSQTQACKDKKIESYPTWEFADQSRLTGEQTFEALADKTACPLPPKV
jgi:thiol-disulfide isomerase/thioredoxin